MVDILRALVERSCSSWWWCYDHRSWLCCFHIHMIWFCVTSWRYDICLVDSWKVMIRLFLLRKRSKLILMRSRGWVDIYMQTYFVTGWWYLHCHILGSDDGHIQVVGSDVSDRCLWRRLYMVHDSCWWLSWSCLDIWFLS